MKESRYARQIAVPGIGEEGQRAIRALRVRVNGEGLDSEICAAYLAGAGVGYLEVDRKFAVDCKALNSECTIESLPERTSTEQTRKAFIVEILNKVAGPSRDSLHGRSMERDAFAGSSTGNDRSALRRGARAARWALAHAIEHKTEFCEEAERCSSQQNTTGAVSRSGSWKALPRHGNES